VVSAVAGGERAAIGIDTYLTGRCDAFWREKENSSIFFQPGGVDYHRAEADTILWLTEKQVDALMAALDNGYYEVPKKKTAEEIARKYGVPRTTYEEHVRKAESKIFRAIAPYIGMYASSAKLPTHGPRARPD
jgi:predicted DNA binding protein